ncbi:two-component system, NarL family, sensor histidine kinase DesK [Paramicrobacterium humi]|uniref:Two-component system, NarL family, sensor histidine kinase DesK n=2 Tax=Paramicrobacterium humi TaxID=640635 RepID=A0A1H4M3P5_9MICO|nr:two-component system, NarL family, sensor histidine kinase DesK [Microbacterium humi]
MTDRMLSADCDDRTADWIAMQRGPWFPLIWLPVLLVAPLVSSIATGRVLVTVTYLVIAAWYVVTVFRPYRGGPAWVGEAFVAVLTVMVAAEFVLSGAGQGFLYPLLAIAMATVIRRRVALGFVMALSISGTIAQGFATWSLSSALLFGFASVMAGVSTYLIRYLVDTVAELRATRRRLAGIAVTEERQRFSRDLHDLLGHTLSVIVVKAEAIRRFAASDTDAVISHAQGIEDVGRTALADVRQAVAGYRRMTLADELDNAEQALADAGVDSVITMPLPKLAADVDALFGWVVREAATNTLRHARASRCSFRVAAHDGEATIEIADNGRGALAAEWGSGLRGLRERVARLGGTLDVDSDARGFVLTVRVPLEGDAA